MLLEKNPSNWKIKNGCIVNSEKNVTETVVASVFDENKATLGDRRIANYILNACQEYPRLKKIIMEIDQKMLPRSLVVEIENLAEKYKKQEKGEI